MSDMSMSLGPELFRFDNFDDWCDHAQRRFEVHYVHLSDVVCVDGANRICRIGRQFMRARDEGMFPIRVYHYDCDAEEPKP